MSEPDYKQLFFECFDAFEETIDGVKEAAPYFLFTLNYLRRRRDCPGAARFDKGCSILNGKLIDNIPIYEELREVRHER